MKNKKLAKRVVLICVCTLLVIAYVSRVWYLNAFCSANKIIRCSVGESVSENAYEYTVNDYCILSNDEFEKKYNTKLVKGQGMDELPAAKILVVNVDISKIPCDDTAKYKFEIGNLLAQALTFSQGINYTAFALINSDAMKLEDVGDKISVKLPYFFYKQSVSKEHWENFENQMLKVALNGAENSKKEIILHE